MRKLFAVVVVLGVAALVAASGSVYGSQPEGTALATPAIAPVAAPAPGPVAAPAPAPAGKTFICHITFDEVREDGFDWWMGKVLLVSDNAVPAHCAHGVGDHNPIVANQVPGNLCGRRKQWANPVCEVGGAS